MLSQFYLKRGDTLPKLSLALKDANGGAVDLSTASSVRFKMSKRDAQSFEPVGNPLIDANATIENAQNGIVSYQFQASETANAGIFLGEFECTFPTGKESFPNTVENRLEIVIAKDA